LLLLALIVTLVTRPPTSVRVESLPLPLYPTVMAFPGKNVTEVIWSVEPL
jgi:hypothetical protein